MHSFIQLDEANGMILELGAVYERGAISKRICDGADWQGLSPAVALNGALQRRSEQDNETGEHFVFCALSCWTLMFFSFLLCDQSLPG